MTVIVGVVDKDGNVVMGGDTAATNKVGDMWHLNTKKVFRPLFAPHMVIGVCGSLRALQIMHYHLEVTELPGPTDNFEAYLSTYFAFELMNTFKRAGLFEDFGEGFNSEIMIGYQGKLAVMQPNFGVITVTGPGMSMGSGMSWAIGSLNSTPDTMPAYDRVATALQATASNCDSVDGPFDIVTLPFDPSWKASKPVRKKKKRAAAKK